LQHEALVGLGVSGYLGQLQRRMPVRVRIREQSPDFAAGYALLPFLPAWTCLHVISL
jgi:hypothetical protein